jgi:hypothetical protein
MNVRSTAVAALALAALVTASQAAAAESDAPPAGAKRGKARPTSTPAPPVEPAAAAVDAQVRGRERERDDLAAMQAARPSYPFWEHVFTVPDGAIMYGSARDGRVLATFPARGDWLSEGTWSDPELAGSLDGQVMPADLSQRRDLVARVLSDVAGPVVHNPSRGLFVAPNVRRYGSLLEQWGAIYERFGVPARIGLAQALVESGFTGGVRSEARAVGLCQWLQTNWRRLQQFAPYPIDARTQTTQAAYCAAYLTVLATKYDSYIPALSEHHTGGANVGRIIINGARLGASSVRDRYLAGAEFVRDVRAAAPGMFSDIYGTYGPRSFLYAEMIFGNTGRVESLIASEPQADIFATRLRARVSLTRLAAVSGVAVDEIRRYNPSIASQVPARTTVYLPKPVTALGTDVSFWRRAPRASYQSVLSRFVALDAPLETWNSAPFDAVLRRFQQQFAATKTEEGTIMSTMLAYVLSDRQHSREREILEEFAASARISERFDEAQLQRTSYLAARPAAAAVQ